MNLNIVCHLNFDFVYKFNIGEWGVTSALDTGLVLPCIFTSLFHRLFIVHRRVGNVDCNLFPVLLQQIFARQFTNEHTHINNLSVCVE